MKKITFVLCALLSTAAIADQVREHIDKGIQYRDAGKATEAISEFEKALKIEPRIPDIYFEIGNLKGCPNSIEYYKKAISLDGKHVNAYYNLGACYDSKKDGKNAIKYYKEVIKLEPSNPSLYYNIANYLSAENKFEEASSYYLKAIKQKPNEYFYTINLGNAYTSLSKYKLAIKSYRKAIKINPNLSYAYLMLSNPYGLQNMKKEENLSLEKGAVQAIKNKNQQMMNVALQSIKANSPNSKMIGHLEKRLNK